MKWWLKNIKVFGYYCVGANNKWEEDHPNLCYLMDGQQIPFTTQYIDYLSASIEDAIMKTDMDGIMLDWFYNPGGGRDPLPPLKWIPCEKEMYQELMSQSFPGKEKIIPWQNILNPSPLSASYLFKNPAFSISFQSQY